MRKKILFSALFLFISANAFSSPANAPSDEEISRKIAGAQKFYQDKYQSIAKEVNQLFGIDYFALRKEYEITIQQLQMKLSLIDKIQDPAEKALKLKEIDQEYSDSRLYQYLEANSYFENEIEKDHQFVGELLTRLEGILDLVVQQDEIFRTAFFSKEFKNEYGLILKRVVWQPSTLKNVSAETTPLNIHSLFGDKTKIPVLIKFTPVAFYSLPFLRSIVIHELNHVCFYKEPVFSDMSQFSGSAVKAPEGPYTHYFKSINSLSPTYQYYLIHEYYSFKTQIIFDQKVKGRSFFQLDPDNRKNIEEMLNWTFNQLNDANKDFIRRNPDPPIMRWIRRFYPN